MRVIAVKLFIQALKLLGLKTSLRLGWRHLLYPRLKALVSKSEEKWDDDLLKFVDESIDKVISSI